MTNFKQVARSTVRPIEDNDPRTIEERLAALPVIRDEELAEWKAWGDYWFGGEHRFYKND